MLSRVIKGGLNKIGSQSPSADESVKGASSEASKLEETLTPNSSLLDQTVVNKSGKLSDSFGVYRDKVLNQSLSPEDRHKSSSSNKLDDFRKSIENTPFYTPGAFVGESPASESPLLREGKLDQQVSQLGLSRTQKVREQVPVEPTPLACRTRSRQKAVKDGVSRQASEDSREPKDKEGTTRGIRSRSEGHGKVANTEKVENQTGTEASGTGSEVSGAGNERNGTGGEAGSGESGNSGGAGGSGGGPPQKPVRTATGEPGDSDHSDSSDSEDSDSRVDVKGLWDYNMTDQAQADALKAKFDRNKGQITKACNKIAELIGDEDDPVDQLTGAKLITWKDRLQDRWVTIENIIDEYGEAESDDTKKALVMADYADYEETYMSALALVVAAEKKQEVATKKEIASAGTVVKDRTLFSFGQRKIKKFDGSNPDLWPVFEEEFQALLDSYNDCQVTDVEKFTLLREHVTGKAADRIAELPLTSADFKDAYELLRDAYGDKNQRIIRLHNKIQDCKPASGVAEGFNYPELDRVTTLFDGVVRALKNLDFDIAANSGWLFANIRRVFPRQLLAMWDLAVESQRDSTALMGNTATVADFLMYARARTRTLYGTRGYAKEQKSKKDKPKMATVNATVKQTGKGAQSGAKQDRKSSDSKPCHVCEGSGHRSWSCPWWESKPTSQLREICAKKSLCYGCGKPRSTECRCQPCKCGKGVHKPRLCYENDPTAKKKGKKDQKKRQGKKSQSTNQSKDSGQKSAFNVVDSRNPTEEIACYSKEDAVQIVSENVVMETLLCKVRMATEDGKMIEKPVRIFLDTGSNMNIIRSSVAKEARGKKSYFSPYITGGERLAPKQEKDIVIQLLSSDGKYESPKFLATTSDNPTAPFPPITFDPSSYAHLKNVKFTEKYPREQFVDIDILVGLQVWNAIDLGEQKRGKPREPIAKKTELGWVLSGLCAEQSFFTSQSCMVHQVMSSEISKYPTEQKDRPISAIKSSLEKLWKLETIGITDPVDSELTIEQERAKNLFYEKLEFRDGKYYVPMLWRTDETELDSNYRRALRRDEALCNKFQKPEFRGRKDAFISAVEEFFENGYAERMSQKQLAEEPDGPIRYLSLQAVFREDKPKPRPVFDASEKTADGKSLNSEILQGPPNISDLVEILLRFRTRPIVVTTDIKAMFLRIGLLEGTDAHRFLWRRLDKSKEVEICRLVTVTFGVIDSPYKSIEVVQNHARVNQEKYPEAHDAIANDSYVDDILSGANSVDEAWDLYQQLKKMMLEGGFHLAKVMSNSDEFMSKVPEEDRAPLVQRIINGGEEKVGTHSALGASWDPRRDVLVFTFLDKFEEPKKGLFTRRVILSQGSKVFDPSGLIAPAMLQVKLILRECAEVANGSWDAIMPNDLVKKFLTWREEIMQQSQVEITRCVTPLGSEDIQLHIMTDASGYAYAACVYVRVKFKGEIKCSLLMSKTRLAPAELEKSRKIPRLELLGCLLGIRLYKYAIKALQRTVKIAKVMFWSDSSIALHWISKEPSKLKKFISNRVKEIRAHSDPQQWKHLPGEMNESADLASRGCGMYELSRLNSWWNGPEVLRQDEKQWDEIPKVVDASKLTQEEREAIQEEEVADEGVFHATQPDLWVRELICRYEKIVKAVRILALILRAVQLFQEKKKCQSRRKHKSKNRAINAALAGVVSSGESKGAMRFLVKEVQKVAFAAEIKQLKKGEQVKSDSRLKCLTPFINEDGVLCVGGRIQHPTDEIAKNPPILPDKEIVVDKLIQSVHERAMHVGAEQTLFLLRAHYWPMGGRRNVKSVISKCLKCRIFKAKPLSQKLAPLPVERLSLAAPFTYVGLDFAGPFYTFDEETGEKVYIALFVCLSTRAAHVELTRGMSTEELLLALKKMVARRGWPHTIFSDNAKTFIRMEKDLKSRLARVDWGKVQAMSPDGAGGIEWCYNAPRAAWWGGHYERFVGLVKSRLKKSLGSAKLGFRQFETTLVEVEAIVNSRPLAVVRPTAEEPFPITPGHFASNRLMMIIPDGRDGDFANESVFRRAKHQQHIIKQLWSAFQREYLAELQVRRKWEKETDLSKLEGKVVVIRDESLQKQACHWPMGVIVRVVAGRDGRVRSCDLRLANRKVVKRPVQLLALVEEEEEKGKQILFDSEKPLTRSQSRSDTQPSRKHGKPAKTGRIGPVGHHANRPCRPSS